MRSRALVISGVVAVLVIAALGAVYLTGLVTLGDPYSGLWNTGGRLTAKGPNGGYLIKRSGDGYVVSGVLGKYVQGWLPLRRDGRTLVGQWGAERMTFEYQPWTGRILWTSWSHGHRDVGPLLLDKATGSTSVPPRPG
jgi:hypothetical protein